MSLRFLNYILLLLYTINIIGIICAQFVNNCLQYYNELCLVYVVI